MNSGVSPAQVLAELKPQFNLFVGIDSDGCAFDSMELKYKECFCPNIIKYWNLQAISKYARESVEVVNLYSRWRGTNRWPALILALDWLRERPEVMARGFHVPELPRVREFIASGIPLSNDGLQAYRAEHPDPELDRALAWSLAVNQSVAEMVCNLPPFPYVRESLELLRQHADTVVISTTPGETLAREWAKHGIDQYVRVISGQEMGNKRLQLQMATEGKYAASHVLMMGDARGDMDAAHGNNALFFPINPGQEEASWERFYKEGVHKFLAGEFAGAYEAKLIAEYEESCELRVVSGRRNRVASRELRDASGPLAGDSQVAPSDVVIREFRTEEFVGAGERFEKS
jgi:phosphoglycolate phosphatase-like HAD superfamily hydrolase